VTKLWALYRETGRHEPRPNPNGRKPALSAEQLEGIRRKIDEQPDITLRELIEEFSLPVSVPALCKTINKKLKLCRKRNGARGGTAR
jgi:transposase